MKTKTKLSIAGGSLVLALLVVLSVYSWPVRINEDLDGIMFRSGISGNEREMTVHMKGSYFRNILAQDEFLGVFYVDGLELPDGLQTDESTSIHFNRDGYGSLLYKDDSGWSIVGTVFLDLKERKTAFAVYDGIGTGTNTWSSAGGLVFTAPASDRAEAVGLANELMAPFLVSPVR